MNLEGEKGFIITFFVFAILALGILFIYFTYFDTPNQVENNNESNTVNTDGNAEEEEVLTGPATLLELLEEQENMSNILFRISEANYEFRSENPRTYFLPLDGSFNPDSVPREPNEAVDTIGSHAVEGALLSEDLVAAINSNNLSTIFGTPLKISEENGLLLINGVEILELEIVGQNSVLYKINGLLPRE